MYPEVVVTPPLVARPLRLRPFRGLRLAPGRIGGQVAARAFARPYRGVAARLIEWERTGQVAHDHAPAIYLHEYTASGITVRGLVGALDITHEAHRIQDVAVLPHEGIHPAHATDLTERMAEMGMNPAPILLVHHGTPALRDLVRTTRSSPPDHQFTDKSGQYHRIWTIDDAARLDRLAHGLAGTHALIADGHHRYAAYWQLRRQHPNAAATAAGLAMLVDQDDTPLYLGAIHRVLSGATLDDLAELTEVVDFAMTEPQEAVSALCATTLVATDGRGWATLALRPDAARLAVEILHEDLLPRLSRSLRLSYAHSVDEALQAVARRRGVAVLMPAPEFGDVLRIADAGRLLPEKATSFQPKPSVGVLIRSLRDE